MLTNTSHAVIETAFAQPPCLVGAHWIEESHSHKHARLPHVHDSILELLFVYSGEGQYMVDGHSYHIHAGDMVICNAGVLHGEEPTKERRMQTYSIALTHVQFENLPPNWLCDADSTPIVPCGMLTVQMGELMRLIYLLFRNQQHLMESCLHMASAVLLLTHDLLSSYTRYHIKESGAEYGILAERIRRYLDLHYMEPLNLTNIAKELHMSAYYLSHVFREHAGMPPMQYVTKRRIGEAQSLLMDTFLSIADIAEKVGYENTGNFSVAFRKTVGMTPTQYRQSFLEMGKESAAAPTLAKSQDFA